MITVSALLGVLIWLVIIGCVFVLLWWIVGYIGLPEPFNKIVRVIIALAAVIFLINMLLGIAGHPLIR